MKSSLNWDSSSTHSKPFAGRFLDIAHPYQLIILILLLSFLNKLAMPVQAQAKNEQGEAHIFQ